MAITKTKTYKNINTKTKTDTKTNTKCIKDFFYTIFSEAGGSRISNMSLA